MRYLIGIFMSLAIISCGDDQNEIDDAIILDYVTTNNLDWEVTPEGVYFIIEEPGSSEKPTASSTVDACYEGYRLDGSVFDTSYENGQCDEAISFPLNRVINGWQIGIPLFGRGGKGTLIIPSSLAYGSSGYRTIGPNEVLAFDIHLIDFQ